MLIHHFLLIVVINNLNVSSQLRSIAPSLKHATRTHQDRLLVYTHLQARAVPISTSFKPTGTSPRVVRPANPRPWKRSTGATVRISAVLHQALRHIRTYDRKIDEHISTTHSPQELVSLFRPELRGILNVLKEALTNVKNGHIAPQPSGVHRQPAPESLHKTLLDLKNRTTESVSKALNALRSSGLKDALDGWKKEIAETTTQIVSAVKTTVPEEITSQ